jgi:hypothetical protein
MSDELATSIRPSLLHHGKFLSSCNKVNAGKPQRGKGPEKHAQLTPYTRTGLERALNRTKEHVRVVSDSFLSLPSPLPLCIRPCPVSHKVRTGRLRISLESAKSRPEPHTSRLRLSPNSPSKTVRAVFEVFLSSTFPGKALASYYHHPLKNLVYQITR